MKNPPSFAMLQHCGAMFMSGFIASFKKLRPSSDICFLHKIMKQLDKYTGYNVLTVMAMNLDAGQSTRHSSAGLSGLHGLTVQKKGLIHSEI
jgi:hypothetical protein